MICNYYGVPENKVSSQLFITDLDEILKVIYENKDLILSGLSESKDIVIPLSSNNDSYVSGVSVFDNGVIFEVQNTIPSAANMYDDFASAKLYVFSDRIEYVITNLDPRLNQESYVNLDVQTMLASQLGKKIEINSLNNSKAQMNELFIQKCNVFLQELSEYNKKSERNK